MDKKFFREKFYDKSNSALVATEDQSWGDCIARLYREEVEKTGRKFLHDDYVDFMIKEVDGWINGEYKSCLMMGGIGVGKTALMKSLMRLFDELRSPVTIPPIRCRPVAYYDASDLCEMYIANEGIRYEVTHCKVLFIDDVGYEANQYFLFGNVMAPIHDILLSRYSSRLPTILATNLNLQEFTVRYGKRVCDRVNELYAIILCPERESYRKMPFTI